MKLKASIKEGLAMASQSFTCEAPQAPVLSRVMVHPAVASTAEEFVKINGSILSEPLPVTEGLETAAVGTEQEVEGFEMVFTGTKRENDFDETEAVDEIVKVK